MPFDLYCAGTSAATEATAPGVDDVVLDVELDELEVDAAAGLVLAFVAVLDDLLLLPHPAIATTHMRTAGTANQLVIRLCI